MRVGREAAGEKIGGLRGWNLAGCDTVRRDTSGKAADE